MIKGVHTLFYTSKPDELRATDSRPISAYPGNLCWSCPSPTTKSTGSRLMYHPKNKFRP